MSTSAVRRRGGGPEGTAGGPLVRTARSPWRALRENPWWALRWGGPWWALQGSPGGHCGTPTLAAPGRLPSISVPLSCAPTLQGLWETALPWSRDGTGGEGTKLELLQCHRGCSRPGFLPRGRPRRAPCWLRRRSRAHRGPRPARPRPGVRGSRVWPGCRPLDLVVRPRKHGQQSGQSPRMTQAQGFPVTARVWDTSLSSVRLDHAGPVRHLGEQGVGTQARRGAPRGGGEHRAPGLALLDGLAQLQALPRPRPALACGELGVSRGPSHGLWPGCFCLRVGGLIAPSLSRLCSKTTL